MSMTEQDAFTTMLARVGISHRVGPAEDGEPGDVQVRVSNGGEDEQGYCGFYSLWLFDKDGRLVNVSHLE